MEVEEESKGDDLPKEDSFEDLKDRARLRIYDANLKVKMTVIDDLAKTPEELKMYPYQVMYLEEREADGELFEAYNLDLVHVRVAKFVEGQNYDLSNTSTLNPQVLAFDKKKETVA